MIEIQCPACGKHLRIADEYAGQAGKCKACGAVITVPAQRDSFTSNNLVDDIAPPSTYKYPEVQEDWSPQPVIKMNPAVVGCGGCVMVPVIIVIAFFGWAFMEDSKRNQRIEAALTGTPDAEITAGALWGDATGTKYDDRVVSVRGLVEGYTADAYDATLAIGPSNNGTPIYCTFSPEWAPRLARLTKGQSVTVRGLASTGVLYPTLRRCRLE